MCCVAPESITHSSLKVLFPLGATQNAFHLESQNFEELFVEFKLVQEEKRQVKEKESYDGESQAFVMKGK